MSYCKNCKSLLPTESAIIFCPFCGETIFNISREVKKFVQSSVEKRTNNLTHKKVNLKLQTFLAILPFCILIAAYRIKKIRKLAITYIASISGASLISFAIVTYFLYPVLLYFFPSSYYTEYDNTAKTLSSIISYVIIWTVSSGISVYFVRKWSKQWNNQKKLIDLILN